MESRNWLFIGLAILAPATATPASAWTRADPASQAANQELFKLPLEKLLEIETGTRDVGVTAWQSTTPIAVISAEQMAATGQNNVFDALMALVPSMSWTSNYDLGNIVRSARLRGMSPGEVLVLIDGKRRHTTARVNSTPGTDQGSNPVDLDLIPMAMVDHVEILLDGASAQYGSDAVAGVLNFILKKPDAHGTTVAGGFGQASRGDAAHADASLCQGLPLGQDGALALSLDFRHQDFAHRTANFFGSDVANASLDYPKSTVATGGFHLLKPIGPDLEAYAFGTLANRQGQTTENVRVTRPFDPTVPLADVYPTVATSVYPTEFIPRETLGEWDGAVTAGLRGHQTLGWDWDLATTYGRDRQKEGVVDDVNPGLLTATGSSPTTFACGTETATQFTTNLDLRRPIEVGFLPAPLKVAFGLEHRVETYREGSGEPASYQYGASSALAGKTPADASTSQRNIGAAYLDLSTRVLPQWVVDVAGRVEDYSGAGIGSTTHGKLTTRYEVTPRWALRATYSNGFHAPTLGQTHFSDTVVYPASVSTGSPSLSVQLPVASAGGAILGEPTLRPEKATNLNAGLVGEPVPGLDLTLDLYRINLSNRIIDTGFIPGPGAPVSANTLALQALAANGNPITPGSLAEVQFFTNGVDTRTQGLDFSAD